MNLNIQNLIPLNWTYLILFFLFFFISFGLGYPALNRIDVTSLEALSDSVLYFDIIENGLGGIIHDPTSRSTRILIPMMAHLLYELLPQMGSWDAATLSMLIVTASFCALMGLIIFHLGIMISNSAFVSIIASFLYFLNFSVSNFYLAGLVDSGFGLSFAILSYVLLKNKWGWLPLIAFLGTLIKEVFLPLGTIFIFGWLFSQWYRTKTLNYLCILNFLLFILISFTTTTALKSYALNDIIFPWQQVSEFKGVGMTHFYGSMLILTIARFLYVFIWLLPLATPNIIKLPVNWLSAMFFSIAATMFLGWWASISGAGFGRGVFNVAAPGFCIAAAFTIRDLLNGLNNVIVKTDKEL